MVKEENMDTLKFALAGNATFTVLNTETGNRFTYKIIQPSPDKPHFVKVLTGSDNNNDFTFIGTIFNSRNYNHGFRSPIALDAQSNKVFTWVWSKLINGGLPEKVQVYHEGRCGKCGRTLTVPESIESGFGPECIKRIK